MKVELLAQNEMINKRTFTPNIKIVDQKSIAGKK